MNPLVRAQWCAALRSGDYQQGEGQLRAADEDTGDYKYCCLGVLTDLAAKAGVTNWDLARQLDFPPPAVEGWAELPYHNPEVRVQGVDGASAASLADLNDDHGWDFGRIADAIDGGAS